MLLCKVNHIFFSHLFLLLPLLPEFSAAAVRAWPQFWMQNDAELDPASDNSVSRGRKDVCTVKFLDLSFYWIGFHSDSCKGSGQCTSTSEVPWETAFEPETLFKDRKLVAGKGGNSIPFGGQGLVSQCIDLIWVQVMSAFIVNGHRYQPLFLNGDRNRSTCITCIPCIPFAGNEQGL